MGKAAGAILGAVIGAAAPSHDLWDFATPIFVIGTAIAAALVGAFTGGLAGARIVERDPIGWRIAGGGVALSAIAPAVVYFYVSAVLPRLPASVDHTPATARERRLWIKTLSFDERGGLALALKINRCAGGPALREEYLTTCPEEGLALSRKNQEPPPQWYMPNDNGWRWTPTVVEGEHRMIVAPDPLSGRTGPVFEVWERGLLVKRESAAAPAFVVSQELAAVEALRRCLAAAAAVPTSTSEVAHWRDLPQAVQAAGGCPGLWMHVANETDNRGREVSVRFANSNFGPYHVRYRAGATSGFQLIGFDDRRRYLVDSRGEWHVSPRSKREPDAGDPPPPACEVSIQTSCDSGR